MGLFSKKKEEPQSRLLTPEYAKEIASAFKTALTSDNKINVIIKSNLTEPVEAQLSSLAPEEIVTLYNFMSLRITQMNEALEQYKEYLKQSHQLADEQGKDGLPEEQVNMMKDAATAIFKERELGFKRLNSAMKKLEKLVRIVSDYSDEITPGQIEKW